MRIAIVDDQANWRAVIEDLIKKHYGENTNPFKQRSS